MILNYQLLILNHLFFGQDQSVKFLRFECLD